MFKEHPDGLYQSKGVRSDFLEEPATLPNILKKIKELWGGVISCKIIDSDEYYEDLVSREVESYSFVYALAYLKIKNTDNDRINYMDFILPDNEKILRPTLGYEYPVTGYSDKEYVIEQAKNYPKTLEDKYMFYGKEYKRYFKLYILEFYGKTKKGISYNKDGLEMMKYDNIKLNDYEPA